MHVVLQTSLSQELNLEHLLEKKKASKSVDAQEKKEKRGKWCYQGAVSVSSGKYWLNNVLFFFWLHRFYCCNAYKS